jgi:hypothetical protein
MQIEGNIHFLTGLLQWAVRLLLVVVRDAAGVCWLRVMLRVSFMLVVGNVFYVSVTALRSGGGTRTLGVRP